MLTLIRKKYFFIFIFFINCSFNRKLDYCKISDKIFYTYCKELHFEKKLFVEGKGGAMMHDVKEIIVSFVSFEEPTLDEARSLFVDVAEGFLKRYNVNEQIRPYLHNYPFTIENLDIMISFKNQINHPTEGKIALIYRVKNKGLFFKGYDLEKDEYFTVHKEPYETALEIVKNQKHKNFKLSYEPFSN